MPARPPRRGFRSRCCRRPAGCLAGLRMSTRPPPGRWHKQQVEGHTHGDCDSAAVGADRITEVTTTTCVVTTRILRYRLAEAPERGGGQHQGQRCSAAAALATRRWRRSSRFQNAGRSPPRRAAPTNGCSHQPLLTAARGHAVVGITSVVVEADAGQWEQTRKLQPLALSFQQRRQLALSCRQPLPSSESALLVCLRHNLIMCLLENLGYIGFLQNRIPPHHLPRGAVAF